MLRINNAGQTSLSFSLQKKEIRSRVDGVMGIGCKNLNQAILTQKGLSSPALVTDLRPKVKGTFPIDQSISLD